jgi:predicted phage gp36 major capsid-like protein
LIDTINKLESSMEIRGERNGDGEDLLQIVENRRSWAVELLEDQDERLREAKQINKRLKAKLKRYEDGTSLNNDVLMADGGNPLFVVNGRLGLKG